MMKERIVIGVLLGLAGAAASAQTVEPSQVRAINGFTAKPLVTVGELVTNMDGGSYRVTGVPDGIGAMPMDENTIRLFVNHEFGQSQGAAFGLANGAQFPSGGRVSVFDLDTTSMEIVAGGLGFTSVVMDGGVELTPANIAQYISDYSIIDRPCSSSMAGPAQGFGEYIYFTGEETGGGRAWALETAARRLYEVPAMGNGAWENTVAVPTTPGSGLEGYTVIVLSDDTAGRPLVLYVGQKDANGGFLERNGLAGGQLYAWVADNGANTNTEFSGTGSTLTGKFLPINSNNPSTDITGDGLLNRDDDLQNAANLAAEAGSIGAFFFSRPEDTSVNPVDTDGDPTTTEIVFASTGRVTNLGDIDGDGTDDEINDPWGTMYVVTLDNDSIASGGPILADITIAYDGNDADKQDFGIRSPDNVEWAGDGYVYAQEDRSIGAFGQTSGFEASIWRLEPASGLTRRAAVVDRSAVPAGQTDSSPGDIGNWETSGTFDISPMLAGADSPVLVLDVQAHSLGGGVIDTENLVQGGQLVLLFANDCLADYNGDRTVDTRDVIRFLNDWTAGLADTNGDGLVDTRDVTEFLNIWNGGC